MNFITTTWQSVYQTSLQNPTIRSLWLTLFVCLALWSLNWLVAKIIHKRVHNSIHLYGWLKFSFYIFCLLGIIFIVLNWLGGQGITTFLGLAAAGLAVSQKDNINNFIGFIFIIWRDLFIIGDRIEIANKKGDVIGIGLFYFSLLEIGEWVDADNSTGRLIKIPNSLVLQQPSANYSRPFPYIWNEISVVVSYSSDWQTAKATMQKIGESNSLQNPHQLFAQINKVKGYYIQFNHLNPTVYVDFSQKDLIGIKLSLRYLCTPQQRRDSQHKIVESILQAFAELKDVNFVLDSTHSFAMSEQFHK